MLGKVVLQRLRGHLLANNLSETFQSTYRAHNSTETAYLDVTSCLLGSADEGRVTILTLLDLSAAFDTLDHNILLARLHDMFDISGKAFEWFSSYMSDRFQSVSVNGRVFSQMKLHYGVPQGSVLGPILFTLYTQPLSDIISQGKCNHHNLLTTLNFTNHKLHLTFIHWFTTSSSVLILFGVGWLAIDWRYTMIKLKLLWSDLVGGSLCHKIAIWELAVMISLSKAMSKASGFTLTLRCLWLIILTTLVIQRILRSEELALFAISWRGKPLSYDVLLCSQSFGLLQLFTNWHHFWSNVPLSKKSKSCSQSRFSQKQTWACYITSQKNSLAPSKRKDSFQDSHHCLSFLWWYPATISVILSLCVHSISYSPFSDDPPPPFQCKMETQGLWSAVVVC